MNYIHIMELFNYTVKKIAHVFNKPAEGKSLHSVKSVQGAGGGGGEGG